MLVGKSQQFGMKSKKLLHGLLHGTKFLLIRVINALF